LNFKLLTFIYLILITSAQATDQKRPNLLFVIADDWGWPHAGVYGAGKWVQTPNFDRLAREGVLINNAFTSNPKCCPCRASILTGRNTWQLKEAVNHVVNWPKDFISFPEILAEAGYFIGLTGKGWGPGDFKSSGRVHNPAGPSFDKFKHESTEVESGMAKTDYARNFIENFLPQKPKDKPFFFWLGTIEPHRAYTKDSGLKSGKKIEDINDHDYPTYYPDSDVIRNDMLDYAIEVEHFDKHLGRAVEHLRHLGELDNTLIVVTSDHGMPFPRVKGQIYEEGFHLPMAIRWGSKIKSGRHIEDFINVRDLAPTFLEAAGVPIHPQITGTSFLALLYSDKSGWLNKNDRNIMLIGKERHDLGRPNNWGYPVRAIRTEDYLFVHNYHPNRWPAGNPETNYGNCDDGPTKSFLLEKNDHWYQMNFGMRPEFELFQIHKDKGCVNNLAPNPEYADLIQKLQTQMEERLKAEGDLRALGQPEYFDTIEYLGSENNKKAWSTYLKNNP